MILCSIVLNNRKLRTINGSYKNKSEYIITVNDQNGMKDSYKKVQYITLFGSLLEGIPAPSTPSRLVNKTTTKFDGGGYSRAPQNGPLLRD